MAQDFMETFGHGTDDRYIAAVDVDGIALAAIETALALDGRGSYRLCRE
jgi:hypothetical protein